MDFVLEQVLCVRSLKNGPVELINKWSLININKCDFIMKICVIVKKGVRKI